MFIPFRVFLTFVLFTLINPVFASQMSEEEQYCIDSGGQVEQMPADFSGVRGLTKPFCNFYLSDGFAAIGLETFASSTPNIAATMIKKLGKIDKDSPLFKGTNPNPSYNVCKNLSGSAIGFVSNGGFANHLGQNDICVFGDGSMVGGWTLIYLTNHRPGFEELKNKVKAYPLDIYIPSTTLSQTP